MNTRLTWKNILTLFAIGFLIGMLAGCEPPHGASTDTTAPAVVPESATFGENPGEPCDPDTYEDTSGQTVCAPNPNGSGYVIAN